MKTEITMLKTYQKQISITVTSDEMKTYGDKVFGKIRKDAKIDGFRKGKAPDHMLKKVFAGRIEGQTIDEAIDGSFRESLRENKIMPLTQGELKDFKKHDDGSISFDIVVEVNPEFELKQCTGFEVEQLIATATEKEIEDVVFKYKQQYGSTKVVDSEVKEGNTVSVSIKPDTKADVDWEDSEVFIKDDESDYLGKEIIGLKKGDEKKVTQTIGDKEHSLIVRVNEVKENIYPEVNDEFVRSLDKKFENVEMFRKSIEDDILEHKNRHAENEMFNKLISKIVAAHDNFEVPPSIAEMTITDQVEKIKQQYGSAGVEESILRSLYQERVELSLKWEYIKRKLELKENITIEDGDIDNEIQRIADKSGIDTKKVKAYYNKEEKMQMLTSQLLDDKVRSFLKENNNIKMVEKLTEEAVEASEADEEPKEAKKGKKAASKKAASPKKPRATKAKKAAEKADKTEAKEEE